MGGLAAGAAQTSKGTEPSWSLIGSTVIAGAAARSEPIDATLSVGALAALRPREVAVLELMAAGLSNDAIADTLHISTKTVERHATAIFDALGASSLPGANRRVTAVLAWLDAERR